MEFLTIFDDDVCKEGIRDFEKHMKRFEVSLRNMHDIVAACIVLHNICIFNIKGIKEYWIIEAVNKLARRIIEGEVREDSELRGEKIGIAEVQRKISTWKNVPIADKENNAKIDLFLLRENEKANNLLWVATVMHETLAESLWQYINYAKILIL